MPTILRISKKHSNDARRAVATSDNFTRSASVQAAKTITFFGFAHGRSSTDGSTQEEEDLHAEMHWSEPDTHAMLVLLGLEPVTFGRMPLEIARGALAYARTQFDNRAPALIRPTRAERGPPRSLEDGTVELHPVAHVAFGLDVDGMRRRLDAFENLLGLLDRSGASHLCWGDSPDNPGARAAQRQ